MSHKKDRNKSDSPVYQLMTKLLHSFRRWANPNTPIQLRDEGIYELRIKFKISVVANSISATDIIEAQLYDLVIKKEGLQ